MTSPRALILFIIALTLTALCCRREVQLPATKGPTVVKTVVIPEDERNKVNKVTIPIDKPVLVDNVKLGVAASSGAVEQEITKLHAGQPVSLTIYFKEVPRGAAARAVWKQKDKTLFDERKELRPEMKSVTFVGKDSKSWKPGKYEAEAWMGGDKARAVEFEIAKK